MVACTHAYSHGEKHALLAVLPSASLFKPESGLERHGSAGPTAFAEAWNWVPSTLQLTGPCHSSSKTSDPPLPPSTGTHTCADTDKTYPLAVRHLNCLGDTSLEVIPRTGPTVNLQLDIQVCTWLLTQVLMVGGVGGFPCTPLFPLSVVVSHSDTVL